MKRKVHFSFYCIAITIVVMAALLIGIFTTRHEADECALLAIITVIIAFAGLFYCPISVSVNANAIKIHRLLSGCKTFTYSDIEAADTCYPSAGGLRLCGSGGFFGYWGYFSDILIGQYFGYYADRSQCFYVKLKNKRQYVISCENHTEIVKLIQKYLK